MTDFLVFFLPLPTVLSLKMHRRQQVIIFALFGAGLIVCAAGIVRIFYAWKTTSTFDRTWVSYPLWISGVLELDIGIVRNFRILNDLTLTRISDMYIDSSMQTLLLPLPSQPSGHLSC